MTEGAQCVIAACTMKRHLIQLGSSGALKPSCKVGKVHIKGAQGILTLVDVGDHLLAFYTEVPRTSIDCFDTDAADQRMEPSLAKLRRLVSLSR